MCLDAENLDDRLINGRDNCLKAYESELMPELTTDGPLYIYQKPIIITDDEEDLTRVFDKETNFTMENIQDFVCNTGISAIFHSSPYIER